jgi:phosphatidylserine/phosphatidylglycerophosphate/cardiolipin synthase-like enzyme
MHDSIGLHHLVPNAQTRAAAAGRARQGVDVRILLPNELTLADLEKAREIRLPEWRRRGVWQRVKERASLLFAEQY